MYIPEKTEIIGVAFSESLNSASKKAGAKAKRIKNSLKIWRMQITKTARKFPRRFSLSYQNDAFYILNLSFKRVNYADGVRFSFAVANISFIRFSWFTRVAEGS